MGIRPAAWGAALLLCLSVPIPPGAALGDVTVQRLTRTGGIGGIGASESLVVEKFRGLRKREVRDIKPTGSVGKVVGKLAGRIGTDEITDIPRNAVRKLDHEKKSYTESRIGLPKAKEDPARARKGTPEKSKVRVIRNEIHVRRTGEEKPVNGFDCRRYVVTWLIELEDVKTRERAKTILTNDLWTTPGTKETRALEKEEGAFIKAYLKKSGIDVSTKEAENIGLSALSGRFGGDEGAVREKHKELRQEIAKLGGYPVVNTVRWVSETTAAARQRGNAEEKAGTAGDAGGIEVALGEMAQDAVEKKVEERRQDDGKKRAILFSAHTEIRKIDLSPVPLSEFQVPAGYERVK